MVRTDAILDILVSTDGEEQLPGLTLDIEHLDAERRAKDRCTFWVETAALARGQSAQVSHVLENVAWETGDAYSVEVRRPIPPGAVGYREFEGHREPDPGRRTDGRRRRVLTPAGASSVERASLPRPYAGGGGERLAGVASYAFMAKRRCSMTEYGFL